MASQNSASNSVDFFEGIKLGEGGEFHRNFFLHSRKSEVIHYYLSEITSDFTKYSTDLFDVT